MTDHDTINSIKFDRGGCQNATKGWTLLQVLLIGTWKWVGLWKAELINITEGMEYITGVTVIVPLHIHGVKWY